MLFKMAQPGEFCSDFTYHVNIDRPKGSSTGESSCLNNDYLVEYDKLLTRVVEYDELLTRLVEYDELLTRVVEYDELLTRVVEYDELLTRVVEYDELLTRVVEYAPVFIEKFK